MQNINKKILTTALIIVMTASTLILMIPTTNAHTPAWEVPKLTLLSVGPSPIGVGQIIRVDMWTRPSPPTGADNDVYSFMVVVMKPDGTNGTIGPFKSDVGGNAAANYFLLKQAFTLSWRNFKG